MTRWRLVLISVLGVFLGGLTATYQAQSLSLQGAFTAREIVALLMGGLAPVAAYLVGFNQYNPGLRERAKVLAEEIKTEEAKPSEPKTEEGPPVIIKP